MHSKVSAISGCLLSSSLEEMQQETPVTRQLNPKKGILSDGRERGHFQENIPVILVHILSSGFLGIHSENADKVRLSPSPFAD